MDNEETNIPAEMPQEATDSTETPQETPVPQPESVAAGETYGPAPIIPPQLAHVSLDCDIKYGGVATGPVKKHSPIAKIYPHNDYVIILTVDGKQHPVHYLDAVNRADQVKQMLLKENSEKPLEERDKEHWLVRELVVAAQRCSEYAYSLDSTVPKFSQRKVDQFLFDLDRVVKQIKHNKK
jgi:hypothetical protein